MRILERKERPHQYHKHRQHNLFIYCIIFVNYFLQINAILQYSILHAWFYAIVDVRALEVDIEKISLLITMYQK